MVLDTTDLRRSFLVGGLEEKSASTSALHNSAGAGCFTLPNLSG